MRIFEEIANYDQRLIHTTNKYRVEDFMLTIQVEHSINESLAWYPMVYIFNFS